MSIEDIGLAGGGHSVTLQILVSEIIARHTDADAILASARDILQRSRAHHLAEDSSDAMPGILDAAEATLETVSETVAALKRNMP